MSSPSLTSKPAENARPRRSARRRGWRRRRRCRSSVASSSVITPSVSAFSLCGRVSVSVATASVDRQRRSWWIRSCAWAPRRSIRRASATHAAGMIGGDDHRVEVEHVEPRRPAPSANVADPHHHAQRAHRDPRRGPPRNPLRNGARRCARSPRAPPRRTAPPEARCGRDLEHPPTHSADHDGAETLVALGADIKLHAASICGATITASPGSAPTGGSRQAQRAR